MSTSKAEKMYYMIKREVRLAVKQVCFDSPDVKLQHAIGILSDTVAANICHDPYRFRELIDISNWKKPPKVD